MRARARERVERHAAEVLRLLEPSLVLAVGWTRLPISEGSDVVHAAAFAFGHRECVIVIDEAVFEAGSPEEREDTVRHELAHLVAWHRYGHQIQAHGREWERVRAEIDLALEEEGTA